MTKNQREKEAKLWEQNEIQYDGFLQFRTELMRVQLPDYRTLYGSQAQDD